MVDALSNNAVNYIPPVQKVGMTQDGRVVYQISSPDGKEAMAVSVPQQNCDKFEKSYNDIVRTTPYIQKYVQENSTPEELASKKKKAKWTVGLSSAAGFVIPTLFTAKTNHFIKISTALLGLAAGYLFGNFLVIKTQTPKEILQFNQATQTISRLDVKPLDVNV